MCIRDRYYYGESMQLHDTDNVQDITPSYPGYPIRLGAQGQYVFIIQELLNGKMCIRDRIMVIIPYCI